MQESYESLLLLDFPIPKPNVVSRLELEEELGIPDPNDSKEWETLRVAPADDGSEEEEEEAPASGGEPVETAVAPSWGSAEGTLSFWDPHPPRSETGRGGGGSFSPSCGRCGRALGRGGGVIRHRPPVAETPWKCRDCGKGLARSSHQRRPPGRGGECVSGRGGRLRACGEWGKSVGRSADPAARRRGKSFGRGSERRRPHTCADCGKSFSYGSAFLKHRRGHRADEEGEGSARGRDGDADDAPPATPPDAPRRRRQPYPCAHCPKAFGLRAALARHQRVHLA